MSNIIFNIAEFECESPIIGDTFRHGGEWTFNWSSAWDYYQSLGINAIVRLFYSGDGQPEQEYTNQVIPGNASSFKIDDILNYDGVDFRLEFSVDDGNTCLYTFLIPNSSVIIT